MATLISKQRTRLGPTKGPDGVDLPTGKAVEVDDERLEWLLAWGRNHGRRLERAGILEVRRRTTTPTAPAPTASSDASPPTATSSSSSTPPETLEGVTVRDARPLIGAVEDLDTLRAWYAAEAASDKPRASILAMLDRRGEELRPSGAAEAGENDGGEGDSAAAGDDASSSDGGDEGEGG